MIRRTLKAYRAGNRIKLVHSGESYFDLLEKAINKANKIIHFHVYIFEEDATGKLIGEALKEAAKRGVSVYLLVDGFGSNSLSASFIEELRNCGINFRTFSPFFSANSYHLQIGRRIHHKVIVTDESTAIIGGINISDKYRGTEQEPAWLDFAVMVEGTICKEISQLCNDIWNKKIIRHKRSFSDSTENSPFKEKTLVRISLNDWIRREISISKSLRNAIRGSKKSVIIVGSYFLPGRSYRRLLHKAAKRGVEIKLIMADISDVPFVKRASNYLYEWLLRNNIRIYEYKPSVLHGKVIIVDDEWCSVGSYNFNYLSEYASVELNLDILDEEFVKQFKTELNEIISKDCSKIVLEDYIKSRSFIGRVLDWSSYQIMRLVMRLFFLLTKKKLDDEE